LSCTMASAGTKALSAAGLQGEVRNPTQGPDCKSFIRSVVQDASNGAGVSRWRGSRGPTPRPADQAVVDPIGGKILTSCCWKALPCWGILRNGRIGRGAVHAVIAAENHRRGICKSQRANPRLGAPRRHPTGLRPTGPESDSKRHTSRQREIFDRPDSTGVL
jgi:hypothetical protein